MYLLCSHRQQQPFNELWKQFQYVPIITEFHITLETIIENDASNQAIVGILSQYLIVNRGKELHPVEVHAKTIRAT